MTRERAYLAIERAIEYLAATPSPDRETAAGEERLFDRPAPQPGDADLAVWLHENLCMDEGCEGWGRVSSFGKQVWLDTAREVIARVRPAPSASPAPLREALYELFDSEDFMAAHLNARSLTDAVLADPAFRAALTAAGTPGIDVERDREDAAKWRAAEAAGHVVEFRVDGYGLQHPPSCRGDLIGCRFNAFLADYGEPVMEPGRYRMTWASDDDMPAFAALAESES